MKPPKIRRLPAVDAILELVGRATEMKKPVLYLIGTATEEGTQALYSFYAPQIISSYIIMSEVCRQTARMGAPFIHVTQLPDAIPIATAVAENAYRAEETRGSSPIL